MVSAVAVDELQIAQNSAHAMMSDYARPPGA
jgi:hypothetical protein